MHSFLITLNGCVYFSDLRRSVRKNVLQVVTENILQVGTENVRRVATNDVMTSDMATDLETTEDLKANAQIGDIAMTINGNGNIQTIFFLLFHR